MSLSKLKQIHVIIIGAFLCIAAIVAIFMLMVKPQNEAIQAAKARYDAAEPKGDAMAERRANTDLQEANKEVSLAQAAMDEQMRRRMPNLDFSRRDIGLFALWKEQIYTLGPLLTKFAQDKNVKLKNANFSIAAPPANPNSPILDQDVLIFPLGQVQVTGDF